METLFDWGTLFCLNSLNISGSVVPLDACCATMPQSSASTAPKRRRLTAKTHATITSYKYHLIVDRRGAKRRCRRLRRRCWTSGKQRWRHRPIMAPSSAGCCRSCCRLRRHVVRIRRRFVDAHVLYVAQKPNRLRFKNMPFHHFLVKKLSENLVISMECSI